MRLYQSDGMASREKKLRIVRKTNEFRIVSHILFLARRWLVHHCTMGQHDEVVWFEAECRNIEFRIVIYKHNDRY